MRFEISPDVATIVSAAATAVYAVISALSLLLLSRQIRDARRFGAAPALCALLKELEEHMAAVRLLGGASTDETAAETIVRYLEFFERVEHLRSAGVLPSNVLRRAFGPVLDAHLADPRFRRVIEQDASQYQEVLLLAKHLGRR
ncbi:hypothetical protein [Acidisoma sp. S159]|uniref:hypothetical protein n=1 Tax=Acidisoma sp. S159 TaxID=1747225 RepID=UPI00131D2D05|nr:hypothetical protein [Acidisoma sp. S159]